MKNFPWASNPGCEEIVNLDVLLKNWSFVCVLQKADGFNGGESPPKYDYKDNISRYEIKESMAQAAVYEKHGHDVMANECRLFVEKIGE